ncbi:hypothetical protein BN903_138 [Halorubrum sp. AJ67]|nr:hypothetical protein BN903_138 [Halorubrum sp. AJ67]
MKLAPDMNGPSVTGCGYYHSVLSVRYATNNYLIKIRKAQMDF